VSGLRRNACPLAVSLIGAGFLANALTCILLAALGCALSRPQEATDDPAVLEMGFRGAEVKFSQDPTDERRILTHVRLGLPFRCLERIASDEEPPPIYGTILITPTAVRRTAFIEHPMDFRPLWAGVVLNSAVWSAVLWVFWVAWSRLSRRPH
jgi:hypothetical protein